MKHEDIPGYTELKNRLFQLRWELNLAKTSEEIIDLKNKIEIVKELHREKAVEVLKSKAN